MMMKKHLKKAAAFLLVLTVFQAAVFGAGSMEPPAQGGKNPRVVSLGPNVTEIIFALGAGDLLVGRTDFCDYPPEALAVESVGNMYEASLEKIISLEPDVVIASTHSVKETVLALRDAGINAPYIMTSDSFEGVYEMIKAVGSETGREPEAEALVHGMKSRIEKAVSGVEQKTEKPSVYYAVDYGINGDWTAGGDTFINELIEISGGRNIASEIKGWSYSREKLFESDPDIIIISSELKDGFCNTEPYASLRAVRDGRVFGIDEDIAVRQGPRLADAVELFCGIFSGVK